MYGNVQAALAFFVEYKNHLTKVMKLEQSLTDPCVFFKKDERGHLALMALTHVDDTLIAGNEEEIKNFKKGISRRFKFRDEGRLKKHLGVSYKWKQNEERGERLIEATMHTLVDGKRAKRIFHTRQAQRAPEERNRTRRMFTHKRV